MAPGFSMSSAVPMRRTIHSMSDPRAPAPAGPVKTARGLTVALYPNFYVWYVFLSSLDIMMTWIILSPPFEGREVNWLANWIIQHGGMHAMIPYKFALVGLVIAVCEIVGRIRPNTGERLAAWSVAITCIPVVVAFAQLLVNGYDWLTPTLPSPAP